MKRILIIGGAGFIGTALTDRHLSLGDFVVVYDNMSNGMGPTHHGNPNFGFVNEDIVDIPFVWDTLDFDVVYHLASESRPAYFKEKYADIIDSNVTGLLHLLDVIKPETKLIYASSSEVYGNSAKQAESSLLSTDTTKTRNVYSISKMLAESILFNNQHQNWNITRFFNVYGSVFREDEDKVIPNLLRAIDNNEPFTIYGDGNQVRCFTHIADIVRGLVMIANSDLNHEIINLGRSEPLTINNLVAEFAPAVEIIRKPQRLGEPYYRNPETKKAKDLLGWHAEITMEDGMINIL